MENQIELIESDLFMDIKLQTYDIIISNPPYVGAEEYDELPTEYRFEPQTAFIGGASDGLDLVARILQQAKDYLTPDGILVVEVGNSYEALIKRYPRLPFVWLEFECGEAEVFLLTAKALGS